MSVALYKVVSLTEKLGNFGRLVCLVLPFPFWARPSVHVVSEYGVVQWEAGTGFWLTNALVLAEIIRRPSSQWPQTLPQAR